VTNLFFRKGELRPGVLMSECELVTSGSDPHLHIIQKLLMQRIGSFLFYLTIWVLY